MLEVMMLTIATVATRRAPGKTMEPSKGRSAFRGRWCIPTKKMTICGNIQSDAMITAVPLLSLLRWTFLLLFPSSNTGSVRVLPRRLSPKHMRKAIYIFHNTKFATERPPCTESITMMMIVTFVSTRLQG